MPNFGDLIFEFTGETIPSVYGVFVVFIVLDWFRSMFFKG